MLARASFQSFKALKAVDVDLSPFTVIVGKNASGKTSVLQGIRDVSQVPVRDASEAHPGKRLGLIFEGEHHPARLVTRPGGGPMKIGLTDTEGGALSVEARLSGDEAQARVQFVVTAPGNNPPSITLPGVTTTWMAEAESFLGSPAVQRFGSAMFLRLDAAVMTKASATDSEAPRLAHDGEGLASVLSYMAGAEPDVLEEIRKDLAAVVPQVRRIRTFPTKVLRPNEPPAMGHRFELDMGEGRLIPADMLSEGTVLALGLLTALRHPECPRLVLMDDVDSSLHSTAQAELVRCLRGVQRSRPDVQIVCTSHSPDFLDQVRIEEVRVMELDEEGHAHCRALGDHPEAGKWSKMLRTGEFWASVGEDWLLEGGADGR